MLNRIYRRQLRHQSLQAMLVWLPILRIYLVPLLVNLLSCLPILDTTHLKHQSMPSMLILIHSAWSHDSLMYFLMVIDFIQSYVLNQVCAWKPRAATFKSKVISSLKQKSYHKSRSPNNTGRSFLLSKNVRSSYTMWKSSLKPSLSPSPTSCLARHTRSASPYQTKKANPPRHSPLTRSSSSKSARTQWNPRIQLNSSLDLQRLPLCSQTGKSLWIKLSSSTFSCTSTTLSIPCKTDRISQSQRRPKRNQ